jgi:hypothetical protein
MTTQLSELREAQYLLGEIINYFDEIEEQLTRETKFPVKLLQKAKAFQAFHAVSEVIDEYDEARRLRKHWEPDEVAERFIRNNIRFLMENDLTPATLAEKMGMPPGPIESICDAAGLSGEEWGDD